MESEKESQGRAFRGVVRWYLCVALLLLLQLVVGLFLSIFGPSENGLERFIDLAYSSPASRIGNVFFENQITLGNAPLGMGLMLLVVILYAFLGGTAVYLICIVSSRLFRGKQ
jgi:hypothetical protein